MRAKGLEVGPGDFAENITTEGLDLTSLPLGAHMQIGEEAILEITQIGKECHTPCSIYYRAGECVMPKEGIFTRVIKGGYLKVGDAIVCYQPRQACGTGMSRLSTKVVRGKVTSFLGKFIDAVTFNGYNSMRKEAARAKRIREENLANLFSPV